MTQKNEFKFVRLSVARQMLALSKTAMEKIVRAGLLRKYYIDDVRVPYVKLDELRDLFDKKK